MATTPFVIEYPYEVYKTTDHCVDDVNSKLYNKIIDSKKVKRDYKSKEYMKFPKDYYRYPRGGERFMEEN